MFLAPDSEEQEIANAADSFLGNEFPLERLHACPQDPQNLAAFAELGWLGLTASAEVGGVGLSIIEEMLFFLEHGRVAGPIEVLAQILAVAVAQEAAPELCAPLIAGEEAVALVVERKEVVVRLIGHASARYAVEVRRDGAVLFEFNGDACREILCLDRSVAMWLGDTPVLCPVANVDGIAIWQKAQIDVAAMMIGLAQSAMDMIVEYAKERQTFGRLIGSYQAVRHPCADMATRIEGARSQLFYAATALKEGHADAAMQVDAAVLLAERAAKENVDGNIQLHGGIGVTDEHSAHLLMKRANLLTRLLGSGKQMYASLLNIDGQLNSEGK